MSNSLSISQAIDGFLLEKRAQGLSPHTIADYLNGFRKLLDYLDDDPLIDSVTVHQIRTFMDHLATTPRSQNGVAPRGTKPLSKKSRLNIHTALSSLWTWAVTEGLAVEHVVRQVPRPKPEKRAIVPFTETDVRALLDICERSRTYTRPGKRACNHRRPTALRDRAMILLLVDTGVRASELCNLSICDVDLTNQRITVMGKGSKERFLPFSTRTAKAIWKYLAVERGEERVDAVLLTTPDSRPYHRQALYQLMQRLGKRAGVPDCHPHRFRHTFAVNFLRNGGNVYALQMALGHTTLEMVQVYLELAQADLEEAHRQASPVANWRL